MRSQEKKPKKRCKTYATSGVSVPLRLPNRPITDVSPEHMERILNGKNVILFGPPGIGKSTLIGVLKLAGYKAIDLEDLYPSRVRFQIPSMCTNTFIAAADLSPAREYNNCIKVLLYAEQDKYDHRRSQRDHQHPAKEEQRRHLTVEWTLGVNYHFLLDTTLLTAGDTAWYLAYMLDREPGYHDKPLNLMYGKGGLIG